MEIALCGLSRSGKSTLWSILTGTQVVAGARAETRKGICRVPDPRLDKLSAVFKPKKTTPATVTYVDFPAVERGTSGRSDNPVLTQLRTAEALLCVLRVWDDPAEPNPEGSINPARDLSLLETEFLLADLEVAQRRFERLDGIIKKTHRDEDKKEKELFAKLIPLLESEIPLRAAGLTIDEQKTLRGFAFLTAKPLLLAVNLSDDRIADLNKGATDFGLPDPATRPGTDFVALSAKIEAEIATLSTDDATAFRADLGIIEPALDRLIHASYRLLGQISFFTVGDDECRAWTVPTHSSARSAGGAIHSDIERGFIRAEVVPWDKLLEAGSLHHAKEKAWLRLEGKEYVVQDGDVIHFRHSG